MSVGSPTGIDPDDIQEFIDDNPEAFPNLIVEDEGVVLAGGPFTTLNLVGSAVTATDAGGGKVDLTFTGGGGVASELAAVTAERTTQFAIPLSTPIAINYDTTVVENVTAVVGHPGSNTARIVVGETGLYLLSFNLDINTDPGEEMIEAFLWNVTQSSKVPGSDARTSEDDEWANLAKTIVAQLSAGDEIEVEIFASGTGNTVEPGSTFTVARMSGEKGEKGDTGSGSTVVIQDEGVVVAGGPHAILNFVGANVTVTDAGGGKSNISVTGTGGGATKGIVMCRNTNNLNLNNAAYTIVDMTGTVERNTNNWTVGSEGQVTIPSGVSGIFVSANVSYTSTGQRVALKGRIYKNGVAVGSTFRTGYLRASSGHNNASVVFSRQWISVAPGDQLEVRVARDSTVTTAATQLVGECHSLWEQE